MFRKRPKNPLQQDLKSIILWFIMCFVAVAVGSIPMAAIFFLFAVYYIWHRKRTKKKIADALEKRAEYYGDIYGYEDESGSTGIYEDEEE